MIKLGSGIAAACCVLAVPAVAQTVSTSDRGWYNEFGLHQSENDNYIVGSTDSLNGTVFRNFFVFDIPSLGPGENYTLALLRLFNDTSLVAVPETFRLWSVEGSIDALVAGTGGPSAVEDLGDGTEFGTALIDTASGNTVDVQLNSAGLAAVNARKGQRIAFGGTLTNTGGGTESFAFGYTGNSPANPADGSTTLTLRPTDGGANGGGAVPEPGEWAVFGVLGTTLAALVVRKRRRA